MKFAHDFQTIVGRNLVGELKNFIVTGHSEILLRKTIGPMRPAAKS